MGGKHLRIIGLAQAKVVIAHNLMHLARLKQRGIVSVPSVLLFLFWSVLPIAAMGISEEGWLLQLH